MRRLDRRQVLSAGALALASPYVRAATPVVDTDVLVVGAGIAGLAAATELEQLGKSCILVEARSRIGGRVFTETGLGATL